MRVSRPEGRPSARRRHAPRAAAAALLALALHAPAAAAQRAPELAGLQRIVETEMRRTGTPGVAIALVRGHQVLYARGFGVASVETNDPMSPEMLFQIGSLTKPFTAALLVTLAERGTIRLDQPVGHWVTGLPAPLARVTVHQLLSQVSGLKDQPADSGAHDEDSLATFVRSWGRDYAMLPPGTVFSYSNPGFALAGLAAQDAARTPFATLMAERLFRPLGMPRTTFRPTEALSYPRAAGHSAAPNEPPRVVRPVADDTRFWPAGYMFSSAAELARFAIAFMNDGRIDGAQALAPTLPARMARPRAVVPNPFDRTSYGYGLFIDTVGGAVNVWHPGSMPGFSALMRLVPVRRVGVIVLANRDQVRLEPIANAALGVVAEMSDTGGTAPPPGGDRGTSRAARRARPISASEMREYAGRYANRWRVELFIRNDSLLLRRFGAELPVTKIGPHRFVAGDPRRAPRGEEFDIRPRTGSTPAYVHMYLWAFGAETPASR